MRDDFPLPIKEVLAKRVSSRCSNPACRKPTSGPQEDSAKAVNIGVAAHITSAAEGGPRYNAALSGEERKAAPNGIWLCQSCGKLVDNDDVRYTVEMLQRWKTISETAALRALESNPHPEDEELLFLRLEQLMPDLLEAIRQDLAAHPLVRECVPLKKIWTYYPGTEQFMYYYEDVPQLDSKLRILENYNLIRDLYMGDDPKHYVFTEGFVRYFGV
jgi:hypothetical protein